MNRTHTIVCAMGAMIATASGCAGSETGNGRSDHDIGEVSLSLGAPNAEGFLRAEAGDGTVFLIAEADVRIASIDVKYDVSGCPVAHDDDCERDETTRLESDGWIADLINGVVAPALVLPESLFHSAISEFKVRWGGEERAALWLAGELVLPGATTPIPFDVEVAVENTTKFEVNEGEVSRTEPHTWLLSLDPAGWFQNLGVASCLRTGDLSVGADGVLHLEDGLRSCEKIPKEIAKLFVKDGRAQRKR